MQTARCRASTPDQLARLEKRKEERGIHVPEAKLASGRLVRIRLPYDGLNNAGDEIPILGDVDRYNGLNVEHVLGTVIRLWRGTLIRLAAGFCTAFRNSSAAASGVAAALSSAWRPRRPAGLGIEEVLCALRVHLGRTLMRNDWSGRYAANVWIM